MMSALPVDAIREPVLAHWRQRGCLVQSPPGSGKTTRLPLWLLAESDAEIILLLPRRLPVTLAARRLAEQLGQAVGGVVGYSLRDDTRRGDDTRLTVTTYGAFLRRLQQDPALEGVGTVILDEFHERQLDQDTCLTLLHSCRELFRDDLKLLVMSATLTLDSLRQALRLPTVESDGELHELDIRYRPGTGPVTAHNRQEDLLLATIDEARERSQGHILVFLPGLASIESIQRCLAPAVPTLTVHSRIPQDDLHALLESAEPTVILSTNIAESSVTLPGVRCVIDSGLERYPVVNPITGLTELRTRAISKSSSRQRAGRAARLGPGVCYRLWSREQQDRLAPDQPPEITQGDLVPLVLTLARWGLAPDEAFWLTPPTPGRWRAAESQLRQWGALDARGGLTAHGRQVEQLGLEPALAQVLIIAQQENVPAEAIWFAALQVLDRPLPEPVKTGLTLTAHQADAPLRREAGRLARRLGVKLSRTVGALPDRVLVRAWPHRLIRVKSADAGRGLLATGQAVRLDAGSERPGWYLLLSGQDFGQEVRARQVLALAEPVVVGALPARKQVGFHPERARGQFTEQHWLGPFLVAERVVKADPAQRRSAWLEWLAATPLPDWPQGDNARPWLDRYRIFHRHVPDAPLPPDAADLAPLAEPYLAALERLAQLDTVVVLEAWLGYQANERFRQACPIDWQAPSGRQCRLVYEPAENRVSAQLKLQEAFGLTATPTIAGGRQPITLQLAAPDGRILAQVTDLPYFWHNVYPEVRKEMRGRYTKHPWPEDPLTAPATRATKRQLKATKG